MGISCNGHNFNNIDQIYFKLGGDVPWVDLYQVCSNGHALLIFGFFMNLFVLFWGKPSKFFSSETAHPIALISFIDTPGDT